MPTRLQATRTTMVRGRQLEPLPLLDVEAVQQRVRAHEPKWDSYVLATARAAVRRGGSSSSLQIFEVSAPKVTPPTVS